VEQPVEQPMEQPVEQQAEQPVEQQAERPVEQQAEQPVEQQAERPVEQTMEQQEDLHHLRIHRHLIMGDQGVQESPEQERGLRPEILPNL
jgi:hypothetical protein